MLSFLKVNRMISMNPALSLILILSIFQQERVCVAQKYLRVCNCRNKLRCSCDDDSSMYNLVRQV